MVAVNIGKKKIQDKRKRKKKRETSVVIGICHCDVLG